MWFINLFLILEIKSFNFRDKICSFYLELIFQKIRDLETRELADKYYFCILFAFVCLFILNFPYVIG